MSTRMMSSAKLTGRRGAVPQSSLHRVTTRTLAEPPFWTPGDFSAITG